MISAPEDAISTQFPFPMLRRALRHSTESFAGSECDINVTVLGVANEPGHVGCLPAPYIVASTATVVRADLRDKFDRLLWSQCIIAQMIEYTLIARNILRSLKIYVA